MKKLSLKVFLFFIGLALVFPAVFSFFDPKMPSFHDETQLANVFQYQKTISLGQFPPRWAPDMHFEYGSPFPEFNYQLPYYLTFIFSKLGLSLTWSFKMVMVLSVFIGYTSFFLLSVQFAPPAVALLGALVYTYTPYRAVNLFVRGTLGESLAFSLFPFILLFLLRIIKKPCIINSVGAGIFTALLIITHQPATILTLPFIYLLTLGISLFTKNIKSLSYQIFSGLIAIFLSTYYWLPVLLERKFLIKSSPFNFYDHFPFIKQLIYSPWGYGSSNWGPYDDFSLQIGLINIVFVAFALIISGYLFLKKGHKEKRLLLPLCLSLACFFLAVFLMNIRSTPFWTIFPFTQEIQFPWRILMVTTFFSSLLGVISLTAIPLSKTHLNLLIIGLSVSVVALNVFYFRPGGLFSHDDSYFLRRFLPRESLKQGEAISPLYLQHSEDYVVLPINAVRPTSLPAGKITSILPDTKIDTNLSNPFNFSAKIVSPYGDKLTIHDFYFPGWVVKLDNLPTKLTLNYYGAMTLSVSSGSHTLNVYFADTPTRFLSNIISLGTLIVLVIYIFYHQYNSHYGKRRN